MSGNGRANDRFPEVERSSSAGFTYLALLASLVIIGISLGVAGKYWSNVMARDREEELLFRGEQYRRAIELYVQAPPGNTYPAGIDALLKDDRTATGKRHLRRKYLDPVTGKDFELLRDKTKGNRIYGVRSTSDKRPIKQGSFPKRYEEFMKKDHYSEWEFKYDPPPQTPVGPPR